MEQNMRQTMSDSSVAILDVESLLQQSYAAMAEALEKLGNELKSPYLEALDLEPDLVERETPRIDFLRTEDFNATAATRRLALYWKYRKEYFGNRWLLPMIQTGTGALNMEDVKVLRSGYFVGTHDSLGGIVVIQNNARLPFYDNGTIVRCSFYWNAVFGGEAIQTNGYRCIHVVSSAPTPVIDVQSTAWDVVSKALPVKVKGVCVVKSYEEARQTLVDFIAYQTAKVLELVMGGRRSVDILDSGSAQSNLRLLEQLGVPRYIIPQTLNGSYQYSEFEEFLRTRISIESIMASAPPVMNASLFRQSPPISVGHDDSSASSSNALTVRPRKQRKVVEASLRSAVYSKRYNHKKRAREVSLKDNHRLLTDENTALRLEHDRLEYLLQQATVLLASYGELLDLQPQNRHSH